MSESRSARFDRAAFFGVVAAVAAPLALGPEAIAEAAPVQHPLPLPAGPLTAGNAHAMRLAQRSPYVRTLYSKVEALARTITDPDLQRSVLGFLHHPAPDYAASAPTPEKRNAVRDALVAAGFMKATDPLSAIFPPGTEPNSPTVLQPFWSTPGSFGFAPRVPGRLGNARIFQCFDVRGVCVNLRRPLLRRAPERRSRRARGRCTVSRHHENGGVPMA